MQSSLQNWQGVRLIVNEQENLADANWKVNLFWIKEGYLYCDEMGLEGEIAARALRILQKWLPFKQVDKLVVNDLIGAEEVFYVDAGNAVAKNFYRRKSYSIGQFLLEKLFGGNLKKKYSQTWPVLPVRQVNSVQIGNARLMAKRLARELMSVKA